MTPGVALTADTPRPAPGAVLAELRRREPRLAAFGLACLAAAAATAALAAVDPRLFGGVSLWLKPMKFFGSVGLFALTWAWYAGLVAPEQRTVPLLRRTAGTLIGAGSFELAYIAWQAARAEASHFNVGDPLHAVLYGLMGIGAVLLIATNLPLAWAIARHPAPDTDVATGPALRRAAVLGLVLTVVLGGGLGGYLSAHAGHAVGVEAGHLAVVGWNRTGGDLRVAHFLGTHAEQAVPLVVLAVRLRGRVRRVAPWLAAAAWTALTLAAFAQAVAGHPFPLG